jgi:hypothetical protein
VTPAGGGFLANIAAATDGVADLGDCHAASARLNGDNSADIVAAV